MNNFYAVKLSAVLSIILIAVSGAGAQQSGESPSDAGESLDKIRTAIENSVDLDMFSGVVRISKNGKPLLQESRGLASRRYGVPNRTDTRFNIGSINKAFTAVAVMQLAQQGKIDLDASIGTYTDLFPEEVARSVTVRHLLVHTSGWGSYWRNPDYLNTRWSLRTLDQYMEFIKDIPLQFEPGSRQRYSNTGYEVLGYLVQEITGRSYYRYIDRQVYRPAGMDSTGSFEMDVPVPDLAIGYTGRNRYSESGAPGEVYKRWNNNYQHSIKGTAAGGGYATAEDLDRFMHALTDNRLLDPEHTTLFLNRFDDTFEDRPARWDFGGGGPGINAMIHIDLESGVSVVVLSNYDPPSAEKLFKNLLPHTRSL